MPDIQALASQVKQLEHSFASWDKIVIWLMAITVIVSLGYFLVFLVAHKKSEQLKNAQAVLIRAQEEKLSTDLKDKELKIAEADSKAARANERAQTIEHDNLALRNDLNTAVGKVAGLQKDAADAKTTQQKVEVELARQRERAAIAEQSLLKLQERIKYRTLSVEQRLHLIEILKNAPKGPVDICCVLGDEEGLSFAKQIHEVIKASGWPTSGVSQGAYGGSNPVDIRIIVRDAQTAPKYAAVLQHAFGSVGIPLGGIEKSDMEEGEVQILVGNKPVK